MAIDQSAQSNKAAKREARASGKQKRLERKAEKEAKLEARRKEWVDRGKTVRLCSLATVEVRKGSDGYQVSVQGSRGFTIAPDQAAQVMRDLETAIVVIRNQQ